MNVLVVADGMGGHAAGEVASGLAVEAVIGFLRRSHDDYECSWPYGIDPTLSLNANRLRTALHLANRRVYRAAEAHDDYTGMGTTLVAALAANGRVAIAHVGDSRMYVLTGGELQQVTMDDSWVATVLAQALIEPAQAARHPMRNVLTNVLGAREETDVHVQERDCGTADRLLLCTDGLHGVVPAEELRELLMQDAEVDVIAASLVRAALDRGGRDNVTALVAVCE